MPNPLRTHNGVAPKLGERVYVDAQATVIGDATLGNDVSVWPGAVIRGDLMPIVIGARSNVQDGCVLHTTHDSRFNPGGFPLTIGEDVVVGHRAVLHGCTVGDRVLVGIGAIVNDGAVVEPEVMIGAGCLVPPGKRLESGNVYVGNPARVLRPLTDAEREHLAYSPQNYVRLKDGYLQQGGR
ncbi:UDP-3-O-[3-hydroxymyristoyl] glucosamine N-acyltransferase [Posidoniimonas corsicana]|uniref:UDP-3-O-[3-hydroxymyristoyl] glucosamine N-acyltransferase n=1 Tax=Posidoniimonas corsicana TaxID=1938618 RepID=A0A5C5V5W4_9BACT|nr:gamma carbonic anhydrase family protein [Posidoniimonas corsicana]TWT33701.1 UDP-3-O-[3-hydroxymyristoyl] glucosamine N-acyltransferase [Posidoniimonas corsicana]